MDSKQLEDVYGAHNYNPLPVMLAHAEGSWITDVGGRRYLDMLAAYSALNFGHRHPRLTAAAHRQLDTTTLTSRAFHNDQLGPFCAELATLTGMEAVLPMNTGAEGVETAIKVARRWGYDVKGVEPDRANIIVFDNNFHGRTTTIVGFSTDSETRGGFGPFAPGFRSVPFGDLDAVNAAIDDNTVAVLVEPIQGEAGVVIPPEGWLTALRELCTARHVLFVADEVQSALGRTGTTFACEKESVTPDVYILGKALGGGIVPLSAVVSRREILNVIKPGQHGSTFGGNPLACAIGREVVSMLSTGEWQARASELGAYFAERLGALDSSHVKEIRSVGLWAGVELTPGAPSSRLVCERLLERGVLAKDTHEITIRLSPPLTITREEIDLAIDALADSLSLGS